MSILGFGSTGSENKKKKEDVNNIVLNAARDMASDIQQRAFDHNKERDAAGTGAKSSGLKGFGGVSDAVKSSVKNAIANPAIQAAQSEAMKRAQGTVGGTGNAASGFQSPYGGTIQQTLDKLLGGEKFSYDFNADPIYQAARDKYQAMGQTAMQDTMGQAAALTGGYGNSYATTAGQQAYQQAVGQINDIIPELQAAAYDRYQNELANTKDTLSILQGLEDTAYNREQDAKTWEYQKERDAVSDSQWQQTFDYGKERDAVSDSQWQQTFDYGKERDAVSDSQWQQAFDYNVSQDALDRAAAGAGGIVSIDLDNTTEEPDFTDFDGNDWYSYFNDIRVNESKADAEAVLNELMGKGLIPAEYALLAASAARGGTFGH